MKSAADRAKKESSTGGETCVNRPDPVQAAARA